MSQTNTVYSFIEIIYDIFNDVSESFSDNCKNALSKTLNSFNPNVLDSLQNDCLINKFSSIKILLLLQEKFYKGIGNNTSSNLLHVMLNDVRYVLENVNENSDFNFSQEDLLQIITSLFKISFLYNSKEDLQELAKFYYYNLHAIRHNCTALSIDTKNLKLRLKVLLATYKVLTLISSNEKNRDSFCLLNKELDVLKSVENIDEEQLIANLTIYSIEEISIYTLLFVIPEYIKCFNTIKIVIIIWENVSRLISIPNSNFQHSRVLILLCYLYDLCFDDPLLKTEKDLISLFFCDENYWDLIQFGLAKKDPIMRKQAMYLFRKTIHLIDNNNISIMTYKKSEPHLCPDAGKSAGKTIMWWDGEVKNELSDIFRDLIIILEFLDEQQIHIIKPIFCKIDEIIVKFLNVSYNGKKCDFSWIVVIFEKMLTHENTQVIKWGLNKLLKVSENFFSDELIINSVVSLLVPTLNNTNLYYNEGTNISNDLIVFFEKIAHLKTGSVFFKLFIKEVCHMTWSPEALFFVVHSIGAVSKYSFWQEKEISEIKTFVAKAFTTHNKIIRLGVQLELLNSVLALTDEKSVSVESIILLLSNFSALECLHRGTEIWVKIIQWLRNMYVKDVAETCLESFQISNLKKGFSQKSFALMLLLFFDAYESEIDYQERPQSNLFVTSKITEILLYFNNVDKRLYCDRLLCDHYVSIINNILDNILLGTLPEQSVLLKKIIPFFTHIISFVKMQIKHFINLKDFYACQLYLNIIGNIMKVHLIQKIDGEIVRQNLWKEIGNDLEVYLVPNSGLPPIRVYCEMKILKILLCTSCSENEIIKSNLFNFDFIKQVNEPLRRENNSSEETRDFQTLWGRINSEYLEVKWEILEIFIRSKFLCKSSNVSHCTLLELSGEALNVGGYGVLSPVMEVLGKIFLHCEYEKAKCLISSIWKLILERRKTDEFKPLVVKFVKMLYRKELMEMRKDFHELLLEYANLIFSDSSLIVVHVFMKHIQQVGLVNNADNLLCQILSKGLIFGPVQKKDERLTNYICSLIESFNLCQVSEYNLTNEIRGLAVQMVLNLKINSNENQSFAEKLIENLLEMESGLNKNKVRYFGDSYIHRVKHRLMQALLLLEPILKPDVNTVDKLSKRLYRSLLSENPQPSVKYQQEWLLVRMLIKHESLLNDFWNYFNDSVEKKTKGLCSLISISYHLCKSVSSEMSSECVNHSIPILLPFCMDQHFEVRLYAQVVLQKLYELAKRRRFHNVVERFEMVSSSVAQSIQRGIGNSGKNCVKLQEDFYLNVFDPVEHYSLQTIYIDLPRLAKIGSDEWISTKVFQNCGLEPDKIHISLKSKNRSLEEIKNATWLVEKHHPGQCSKSNEESIIENYQKKIIPSKSILPAYEESFQGGNSNRVNESVCKDGLIVVASLIDRIPNLGGLARTCEIFGASEYVVGSLKYVEDKQFTSLSVTAEKWLTIKEVKFQNLSDYILDMKQNGYVIIGAEQALYSQSLSTVKFPKKSLLLLGNEKEGIPPNLLPLLDICVEIPQVGIIRSLNVHVTGALFIWEYAKQNYFSF